MAGTKVKAKARAMASSDTEETVYTASRKTTKNIDSKRRPARASRVKVNYKDESESEEELDANDEALETVKNAELVKIEESVEQVEVVKKPIFTTFETNDPVEEGLCVIRSLGEGKFELVNLKNVSRFDIATEETGEVIKATPGRRDMLAIPPEQWDDARVKAELAVKSADGHLFRFMKLPLELRYRIYELIVIQRPELEIRYGHAKPHLALMRTCRAIHNECRPFFWKNNFAFREVSKTLDGFKDYFMANVQEVSMEWWAFYKDGVTFTYLAQCPKLRVLNLNVTLWVVDRTGSGRRGRQWLHQNEPKAARFRAAPGFDKLLQIRGLRKVTVRGSANCTKAEYAAFEEFLMSKLTLPKPLIQSKIPRRRK